MSERERLTRLAEQGDLGAAERLDRVLEREGDVHALEALRERIAAEAAEAFLNRLRGTRIFNARLHARFVGYAEGLGLILSASIYTFDPAYQTIGGELLALPPEHLARWPEALERLETHLDAVAEGGARALERVFSSSAPEVFGFPALDVGATSLTDAGRARHQRALEASRARFPMIAEQTQRIYGLRLPRHVAVGHALLRALTPYERYGLRYLGRSSSGLLEAFDHERGLERPTRDGLDPRLDHRFRCDPPELLTVLHGDTDGLHYGLWYDDPAELPSGLAGNYARDSAETFHTGAVTLRELLLSELGERLARPEDAGAPQVALETLEQTLRAFAEADAEALEADGPIHWLGTETFPWTGGLSSALPPSAGDPRGTYVEGRQRYQLYRSGDLEALDRLVTEARTELERGEPAYALCLGRELHWFDHDDSRALSTELLTAAYEALDRGALADIVRVHHAHRDLRSVAVFER